MVTGRNATVTGYRGVVPAGQVRRLPGCDVMIRQAKRLP